MEDGSAATVILKSPESAEFIGVGENCHFSLNIEHFSWRIAEVLRSDASHEPRFAHGKRIMSNAKFSMKAFFSRALFLASWGEGV